MGKSTLKYDSTNCTGGINGQDDEKILPNQCKDALNVWAPNGVLERRPGYVGVAPLTTGVYSTGAHNPVLIKEDNSTDPPTYTAYNGFFSLDLGGLKALAAGVPRDRWYFGYVTEEAFELTYDTYNGVDLSINSANTNDTQFVPEYYSVDGRWLPLIMTEYNSNGSAKHLNGALSTTFKFVPPNDWVTTSIVAGGVTYTAKFIRLGMVKTDLLAGTAIGPQDLQGHHIEETINGFGVTHFSDGPRYFSYLTHLDPKDLPIATIESLPGLNLWPVAGEGGNIFGLQQSKELAVLASVPEFDEAYLTTGYISTRLARGKWAECPPAIESDAELLAEYTGIELLPTWPKAKFTQYFRGELWVANLEDSPYQVRWSAPQPIYKAWPLLNTEYLIENDKSPITGLYGYGQNMVVFKNDSIYEMVDAGVSANTLQQYAPDRRVAGKGAVSHHSICNVNGRLFFLAEDGVYAYNGQPEVQNLGLCQIDSEGHSVDRIKHIIKRVTPGSRQFAVGVHWSTQHCYLLALPLDGAGENTHVLCYDYENDAWWLWNIPVRIWLLDEGPNDDQILYFADKYGMVYQFDRGTTDHGAAIEPYVITRQMVSSDATLRAREVEVKSTNLTHDLEVAITADDGPLDQETPATLLYTDEVEKDYNTAVYNVDKYTVERDRKRNMGFRLDGNSFRVKVSSTNKYDDFKIKKISVGYMPVGRR